MSWCKYGMSVLTSWWSRLGGPLFRGPSVLASSVEGSWRGRECLLESSRDPRDSPLAGGCEGALGTGREFQSGMLRLGGVGGSLSRGGSPGVLGRGRLGSRLSEPVGWGRSGGGGGGRSLRAGGSGNGLSLWWDGAWIVNDKLDIKTAIAPEHPAAFC